MNEPRKGEVLLKVWYVLCHLSLTSILKLRAFVLTKFVRLQRAKDKVHDRSEHLFE